MPKNLNLMQVPLLFYIKPVRNAHICTAHAHTYYKLKLQLQLQMRTEHSYY